MNNVKRLAAAGLLACIGLGAVRAWDARAQSVGGVEPSRAVATRPANWYEVAGAARRAAGIESWMFIHPTWVNWNPSRWTGQHARELVDGYLLIMIDGLREADLEDGARAASHILRSGMRLVPGMRLGPEQGYHEWTDPAVWQKDLQFYRRIEQQFGLTDSAPFAVDMEPYWDKEPRYPRADDVYAMGQAMGEWLDIVQRKEMWILPCGVHYWNAWILASARAHRGTVHVLDEATYNRRGDDAKLVKMIQERSSLMRSLGMEYVPGFYLRHAMDPELYRLLQQCGIRRCWFFCNAKDDQWELFGTTRWRHYPRR